MLIPCRHCDVLVQPASPYNSILSSLGSSDQQLIIGIVSNSAVPIRPRSSPPQPDYSNIFSPPISTTTTLLHQHYHHSSILSPYSPFPSLIIMASTTTPPIKALLITKTSAYRHASIPALVAAVTALFPSPSSSIVATEDSSQLPLLLPGVDVLLLGDSSGDFLDGPGERDAVRAFVDRGAAVVGIHACTSGEKSWEWYGQTLGGVFDEHPVPQWATVRVHDPEHFITRNLLPPSLLPPSAPSEASPCPASLSQGAHHASFPWFDEWYNFSSLTSGNPSRRELVAVDEASYEGGKNGAHHPLVWTQEVGPSGARVFYTALGHFDHAFSDPWYMEMLERGIYWALRREGDFKSSR